MISNNCFLREIILQWARNQTKQATVSKSKVLHLRYGNKYTGAVKKSVGIG